jgi:NADPH:quinone reductase
MSVKAVRIHRHGGPEELRVEEIAVESPGPGEARVRHTAIGLNFIDVHHRTGRYPLPGFPQVLGMEAAGLVEDVGSGVTQVQVGDRVAYAGERPGSYCEVRVMPVRRLVRLPDGIGDETAAAMMLKGLTAHYLLHTSYRVANRDTVLIHAAAGGVGLILCQWAKHLGARVIGTVSSDEKASLAARYGCDHPIVYSREDVVARVRELSDGQGVPVVYDSVGADTFETSLACLKRRGILVSFGTASGPIPPFDLFRLNRMGSLFVTSPGIADHVDERAELLERAHDLCSAVAKGAVQIMIGQRYQLGEAAQAHRDLAGRVTCGSTVLLP